MGMTDAIRDPMGSLMEELEQLGLNEAAPADVPDASDEDEVVPPESDPADTDSDAAFTPQDTPAKDTARKRAYDAAKGLSRTLSLLHQSAGAAHQACEQLIEALASGDDNGTA